jgi:o-succinylbenzoate synthase
MQIASMSLLPVQFPLYVPFTTALHSVEVKNCILVRLESDTGIVGWGEAAPEQEITGDDHFTAYHVLRDILNDVVAGARLEDEDDLNELLLELARYIEQSSTAVAAVDIALHDLWSREEGVPLYSRFGVTVKPLKTSISIGIMETDALLTKIGAIVDSGADSIKLKIGSGVDDDVELVSTVRARFGDTITLRLDANQAYTPDSAITLLKRLEKFDIEFVEQPVPASDLPGLKRVNDEAAIPVMADEAVRYYDDLVKIVEGDICNRVNLKLMKSGGLHQLNRFIQYCKTNNIDAMIGCMVETPIGISAGVNLALQGGVVRWTDLDGHLFLKDIERVFSGFSTDGAMNNISGDPGLGLVVDGTALQDIMSEIE